MAWLGQRGFVIKASDILDPDTAINLVQKSTAAIAGIVQDTILVLLIVVFMLFEAAYFPAKLRASMGDRLVRDVSRVTSEVQRYLGIKTIMSMSVGLAAGIWVAFCNVDYPVFWGLVAFIMHYIPNIGAFLASIPPMLLAVFENGTGTALVVALGYTVINTVLGNLVEPALMGRRFGLSTLVVFLSLVFWGWVWGPIGMLLSVPLTIVVKIMLEGSAEWRWLAVLLGPPLSAPDPDLAEDRRRQGHNGLSHGPVDAARKASISTAVHRVQLRQIDRAGDQRRAAEPEPEAKHEQAIGERVAVAVSVDVVRGRGAVDRRRRHRY